MGAKLPRSCPNGLQVEKGLPLSFAVRGSLPYADNSALQFTYE